jgi:hypothetical protein
MFPVCNGITSSYNSSDNTIRTTFHFEGRNTSNVTLYPSCVYSENTATSWIGMTPIVANVNPAKVGRPYPGQTTGDYVCKSSPLAVGKTYKTMAQAIVFYDLNHDLARSAGEPILSTTCSSQPIVYGPTPTDTPTPIPTNTPTPTLTPTSTPTPSPTVTPIITPSATPECVLNSCSKKNLGDANCDCIINNLDKEIWIQQYLNPSVASKNADFDGNNIVDLKDYGIWRNNTIN